MFWSSARALRLIKVFVAVTLALTTSLLAQTPAPSVTSGKRPFTFKDMMKLKRVGAPMPSPDGKWAVFDCEDVDLEANTKISHLWIVPANGGESRRLNQTTNHEERPRFSPDGKKLIWTSKATDPTQIWMCDFDTSAGALVGQPHQVTNISTGADGAIWSPDGENIVFVSAVYPDCKDDACNKQRDDELKKSKVKAKVFTRLFYRHWNAYTEFKRSHLFVVSADASVGRDSVEPNTQSSAAPQSIALPRDLTPGDHDVPPFHLGGQDMYAISPDGQELAYTSNIDEVEATSTNNEIFIVPMIGGTVKKISTSPGSDSTPLYSPDGKYIAWRSQARAGFEADKWRLLVQDRESGKTRDLTEKFDRPVGSFTWKTDSSLIIFAADDRGGSTFCAASPEGKLFYPPELFEPTSSKNDMPFHCDDLVYCDYNLYFGLARIDAPTEIWQINGHGAESYAQPGGVKMAGLTVMNDALLSKIDMQPLESFTFKGANDDDVQGFMVKPPGFDPAKKYPLKFLIHGGPQGAWGNS